MKKLFVFILVVFAFGVCLVQHSSVYAAEGGMGHYVPGAMADFGDMAPPSGLTLLNWYNYYNGSAEMGKQLHVGGFLAAKLSATFKAEMLGAVYT
jgi:hypothetical protein